MNAPAAAIPIRIAVIGAGYHSRDHHLPSLRALADAGRGVAVSVVCDLDQELARTVAAPWGAAVTSDWRSLAGQADAALVCLPSAHTPAIAEGVSGLGLPVWVEKPLATSLARAEALAAALRTPAMVSVNRRFNPAVAQAWRWLGGRRVRRVEGLMRRADRREEAFLAETGLHLVDLAVAMAGAPAGAGSRRRAEGGDDLAWTSAAGIEALVRIRPRAGVEDETLTLEGDGWRLVIDVWGVGLRMEEGGAVQTWALPASAPLWERSGALAETAAFVDAVDGRGRWWPTPAEVLPATRLCHLPAV